MKAVVYNGPRDVSVKMFLTPEFSSPNDVIVKITTTNICGSDLHMYEGRTDFKPTPEHAAENAGAEISSCLQQTSPASIRPSPWVRVLPGFRCCRSCEENKMSASTPQHSLRLRLLGTHDSSTSYGLRDFLYRSNVPSNGSS